MKLPHWKVPLAIGVWGAVLFGVLRICDFPLGGHLSICGPWGCGPPVEALVAYHGFWFVLLGFPTAFLLFQLSPARLILAGRLLTGLGIICLILIATWEAGHWWPIASEWQRTYWLQRYLFAIATLVDVPVTQITLAGMTWWATGRWRQTRPRSSDQEVLVQTTDCGAPETHAETNKEKREH